MTKAKHTFNTELKHSEMEKQDNGNFRSFSVSDDPHKDNGIYISICSWDETKKHEEIEQFINRRVTIETID